MPISSINDEYYQDYDSNSDEDQDYDLDTYDPEWYEWYEDYPAPYTRRERLKLWLRSKRSWVKVCWSALYHRLTHTHDPYDDIPF